METLETLARRIEATEDLQSLVRSMKTISAVAVRQYDSAQASLLAYRKTIDLGLQIVLKQHPVRQRASTTRVRTGAVVVFGSERGLCGNFNDPVAELAARHAVRSRDDAPHLRIIAIGSQISPRLERLGLEIEDVLPLPGSVHSLAEGVEHILVRLDKLQGDEAIDTTETIFNQRQDDGTIHPRAHLLLPIGIDHIRMLETRPWPSRRLPTFTVDAESLFSRLVRQHLYASLYHAALASMASENSARLAAMQRAERNIADQLTDMSADYRRLRQDAITTELMDIVGGYEVLRARQAR